MGLNTQAEIEERLKQGIRLARDGSQAEAYTVFHEITKVQPTHEQALIWRAAVCDDPQETISCLELVLTLNPENKRAQAGLEWAKKRLKGETVTPSLPIIPTKPDIVPFKSAAKLVIEPKTLPNETKPTPAPYKRSRFETQSNKIASKTARMPVETNAPIQDVGLKRRTTQEKNKAVPDRTKNPKRESSGKKVAESTVMRAAVPKVALRISERVARNQTNAPKTTVQVALKWPLLFFVLALALALSSFMLVPLSLFLGLTALLLAFVGIFLFNRANF